MKQFDITPTTQETVERYIAKISEFIHNDESTPAIMDELIAQMKSDTGIFDFPMRTQYVKKFGFVIPSSKFVNTALEHMPLVEVGAGTGFLSKIISKFGGDIITTDIREVSVNNYFKCDNSFVELEMSNASDAVKKYGERTVLMSWPPYKSEMDYEVYTSMKKGQKLILIGEGMSGCTGSDKGHEFLLTYFNHIKTEVIPTFEGIYDYVSVWIKN